MAKIRLNVPGAVTAFDNGGVPGISVPPFMVGDPPQWSDSSDATYAELETFEHPDVSYNDWAQGDLETYDFLSGASPDRVTVTVHVRYESLRTNMREPFARIDRVGDGKQLMEDLSFVANNTLGPQWTTRTLVNMGSDDQGVIALIAALGDGTQLRLVVLAPFLSEGSFLIPRTRIHEAYVVIDTGPTDAPPCRIFPRSDGLGVGAGRAYPPPKSQQRSPGNRGVGYY